MVDAPIVIGELWTDVQCRNVGKKGRSNKHTNQIDY